MGVCMFVCTRASPLPCAGIHTQTHTHIHTNTHIPLHTTPPPESISLSHPPAPLPRPMHTPARPEHRTSTQSRNSLPPRCPAPHRAMTHPQWETNASTPLYNCYPPGQSVWPTWSGTAGPRIPWVGSLTAPCREASRLRCRCAAAADGRWVAP